MLILLTTSDSRLNSDIVLKATELGVRVFQMKATILGGNSDGTLYMGFGRPIPFNYISEASFFTKITGAVLTSMIIYPLEIPSNIDDETDYDD